MILTVENKKEKRVKSFSEIEKEVNKLKPYGKTSFAILEKESSYMQVAGGGCTCSIEYCPSKKEGIVFRAYLKEKKVPFEGEQELFFGGGKLMLQPEEFLFSNDVVKIFKSYFDGVDFSDEIKWRKVSFNGGI